MTKNRHFNRIKKRIQSLTVSLYNKIARFKIDDEKIEPLYGFKFLLSVYISFVINVHNCY